MRPIIVLLLLASTVLASDFPPPPRNFVASFPPPPANWTPPEKQEPDVELIVFGAEWCQPCKRLAAEARKLKADGWRVRCLDVKKDQGERWVRYFHENFGSGTKYGGAVPRTIVFVDGEPWNQIPAERSESYLRGWMLRAANRWREKHGLAVVPIPEEEETTTQTYRSYTIQPYQPTTTRQIYSSGCGNPACRMCYGR